MLELIKQQGNEPSGVSGAAFAEIVRHDSERWGDVIKAAHIRLD